ncbi:MAG: DUF1294 domain-containing protein [Clostridiaceae bacterium]|nr:DUF1294 domain-containing protein [Clostridiaceae bacterium]
MVLGSELWPLEFHYKWILLLYIIIINIFGFIIVGIDKYKASKKLWRIPERNFFIMAALGAAPGVYLGILNFRHKTKHLAFMAGIPAIFISQVIVLFLCMFVQ